MKYIKKIFNIGAGGLIGGAITAILGLFLVSGYYDIGTGLVQMSYNLSVTIPRFFEKLEEADEVVMVYMDDDSYEQLGQNQLKAWHRSLHALLLERLQADGAKAAVFDVIFNNPTEDPAIPGSGFETADEHFAHAIGEFGKAVLGVEEIQLGQSREGAGGHQYVTPIESLMEGAGTLGTVYLDPDGDLVVREHRPKIDHEFIHSMSWATAVMLGAPLTYSPDAFERIRWINYYGPPLSLPSVSYYHVFDEKICPPGFFKDKVVFIGARILTVQAGERKDAYPSPYSYWVAGNSEDQYVFIPAGDRNLTNSSTAVAQSDNFENNVSNVGSLGTNHTENGVWKLNKRAELFMPGVEIHATMFLNILRHDWLTRLDSTDEMQAIFLLGIVFGISLAHIRPLVATAAGILAIAAIFALAYAMVTQTQYWFAWVIIVVQIVVAMSWSILYNSVNLYVQKQLLSQSVSMYVSPAMVPQILKDPDIMKPGAVKKELSILFSDIANFTAMSEGMDPDELARRMNAYFEKAVTYCIQEAEGTVVKFIGDAIFAIWNAPIAESNHREYACIGAIKLRDGVKETFADLKTPKPVRTRIGLHSGEANVGNFGSSRRVDYTAFGENINLAARMEGLNKYLGTDILVTGSTLNPVKDKFVARFLGRFILKGFGKSIEVYELLTPKDREEESRPLRDVFDHALQLFYAKKFPEAEEAFKQVFNVKPEDGPAQYYLNMLKTLDPQQLPENWDGAIELAEK